jgi:hypothetical protein
MSDSFDANPGPDTVTETTTQGYGSRLGGSLVAALFGFILVPVAIVLLYWNEGRAVDAIRALNRGAAAIIEIDSANVDPSVSGKLVHMTGTLLASTPAKDPLFGVTGDGLVRLRRNVEMYQWREDTSSTSQQNLGGSKTTETKYTYQKVWSESPIDSSHFKVPGGHQNPAMPERTATFDGNGVTIGAWRVDPSVLHKVEAFTPLRAQSLPPSGWRESGDGYYHGQNREQPAIGDQRVSFAGVPTQIVSVAAAAGSATLTTFRDQNGYAIALIELGAVSAATLFHDELKSEGTLTWILRGVGFVLVLVGLICLTRPLTMLFAILPFLESLVGAGVFLVALTLAIPITLLTIAIAWIAHRPLIGGLLLAGAIVAWLALKQLHPKRSAPAAT